MSYEKNIELIIDGIAPEKVMYDTDNHSLVVLYPAQKDFKRGDILASKNILLIFDEYANKEKELLHSLWNNIRVRNRTYNKNWTSKYFTYATDEQIAQLHKELRKEGKRWNAETLQIEDIKPEFKKGDILASGDALLIFDEYATYNKEKDMLHSLWNNTRMGNKNWTSKYFTYATDEQKAQVHELLRKEGKKWNKETLEIEDLDISEIVYNLSSACSYLNKSVPDFKSLLLTISNEDFHKYKAQITLQLIREAWNKFDGFEVDWKNSGQSKYYPIINLFTGNIKVGVGCVSTTVHSACYSFKSKKRAIQFGSQFKELFKTAMGL